MKRALPVVAVLLALSGLVHAQETAPIVAEGVIRAPIDAVWSALATSEGLRAWLAPHAEIDLRVGGLMRTNYSPTGALGDPETIENRILSFEPGRMLSIQVSKAPVKFPFPNAINRMWTILYLESSEPARTRVRVVGLGFGPDEESQRMRAFFEKGNAITVDQLRRRFEKDAR